MNPVCCIIVTFNIGPHIIKVVENILPQVERLIIVDNGSSDITPKILESLKSSQSGKISLVINESNEGIAAALNTGVKKGLQCGFEWILILDHDSLAAPDMVTHMLETHESVIRENPGIISPVHIDQNTGKRYRYAKYEKIFIRFKSPHDHPLECSMVMTSGSLIPRKVFEDAGLFNEDYFMYWVDKEFCRRVTHKGYRIFVSDKAFLHHREGKSWSKRILFYDISMKTWEPVSMYYIFRNLICDFRRDSSISSRLHSILFLGYLLVSIILTGGARIERLKAVRDGIRDGRMGKLGKSDLY